ncbi:MAG: hypothetical protein WKG52_01005 [Variovorax sp.]
MGRPRSPTNDLPQHMQLRNGTFYFVEPGSGKWVNLGRVRAVADIRMRELRAQPLDLHRVPLVGADAAHFARFAMVVYRRARARAVAKAIRFDLTEQSVLDLLIESQGRCVLSDIEFTDAPAGKRGLRPWMPSLDRIEAHRGYEVGNVRVVCLAVNLALSDFGDDVLMAVARAIAGRSISSSAPKRHLQIVQ